MSFRVNFAIGTTIVATLLLLYNVVVSFALVAAYSDSTTVFSEVMSVMVFVFKSLIGFAGGLAATGWCIIVYFRVYEDDLNFTSIWRRYNSVALLSPLSLVWCGYLAYHAFQSPVIHSKWLGGSGFLAVFLVIAWFTTIGLINGYAALTDDLIDSET